MESITDTLQVSAGTIKFSLEEFPFEILVEIAGHVAQDRIVLPETQKAFRYTTKSGESQQYWPWLFWTAKERIKNGYIVIHTYNKQSEENNNNILNLSLTCSRIAQACERALY
ncbi:hypothetical protein Ct61P_05386 [Colletotrichum tofieldiae]|nr:hypothetical protein Ct61P_05386 [Colletotrichum tofieldiae]